MPQPYDYSLSNAPSPMQDFMTGLQGGAGVQALGIQQQQQQLALRQQQVQQQALQQLMANPNPTANDYANASILVPGMRENFKQAWDMRNTQQQQNDLSHVAQVYAALQAGQPEIASQLLKARADALRNSGNDQDAKSAEAWAGVALANPAFAKSVIGMKLAAIPGGDKVIAGAAGLGGEQRSQELQPSVVAKAVADASAAGSDAVIKGVQAGNAPTATVLGNAKTAQEIKASELAGDISRLNAQIAAANSETERGRLTLERDKMVLEQNRLQQTQGQQAQDSQNMASNALQTLAQIKAHPGMTDWNRPGEWTGAVLRYAPGTDRQALEGWIDSLKGQLGYSNLMSAKAASPTGSSGFGALSEGELKMLSGIAGNLDPNSKDFTKQLASVERYLQKTQATAVSRPQLPSTGEAFVMKHPVYGNVTEGQLNSLMRQFPGSTRDQVLQFLKQTGGK